MNPKTRLIALFVSILILLLLSIEKIEFLMQKEPVTHPSDDEDFSGHPLYRNYRFGDDSVIDIGIQPLYSVSSILEVMKRDKLLKQALARMGMEIRFHSFLKGKDLNFFLERGSLDVGMAGDMPALTLCAKKGIVIASLIEQGFASIISDSLSIFSELKGKKVAYADGSNAHRVLLILMDAYGLTEKDVTLVPLDVTKMPAALTDGRVDAFSAWEPTPTISLFESPEHTSLARGLIYAYLYFSPDFAAKQRPAIRHILASQIRSMNWLRESPENLLMSSRWAIHESVKIGADFSSLPEKNFLLLAKNSVLRTTSVGQLPKTELETGGYLFEQFQFLKKVGKLPAFASWEQIKNCFDASMFNETLSQQQQFRLETFVLEKQDK